MKSNLSNTGDIEKNNENGKLECVGRKESQEIVNEDRNVVPDTNMNDIINEIVDTIEVRYIPLFSTPLGVPVIADKISPFPETKIIGKISIDTKNAIFKKKPCIPKHTPSIL